MRVFFSLLVVLFGLSSVASEASFLCEGRDPKSMIDVIDFSIEKQSDVLKFISLKLDCEAQRLVPMYTEFDTNNAEELRAENLLGFSMKAKGAEVEISFNSRKDLNLNAITVSFQLEINRSRDGFLNNKLKITENYWTGQPFVSGSYKLIVGDKLVNDESITDNIIFNTDIFYYPMDLKKALAKGSKEALLEVQPLYSKVLDELVRLSKKRRKTNFE